MNKTFKQYLKEMSQSTARDVESRLNTIVANTPFDIVFTNHFYDRLAGRESSVTPDELVSSFEKFFRKFHETLTTMADKTHAEIAVILKDYASKLNIPLEIEAGKKDRMGKYTILGITIMRKNPRDFRSSGTGEKQFDVY